MDEATDDIEAPSIYGVPLYMCCFSTVVVTLVEARGLAAADMSGTSDPFIIVDLVDVGWRKVQPEGKEQFNAANEKEGDEDLNDSDVSDNTDEDKSPSISHKGQSRSEWHGLVKSNSAYQPHSRLGGIALQRTHTLMPGRDILDEEPKLSTFPPSVSFDAKDTGTGSHFLFNGSISAATATKKNKPSINNPRPLSRSLWRHRSNTISRTLDPNWNETVRWTDIKNVPPKGVPFSRLALRVRIYDADYLGSNDFLGQVILRLDDLESTQRTKQNEQQLEQQKDGDSSEKIVQLHDGPSTFSSPISGKTSPSRSSASSSTSSPAFSGDRFRRKSNLFNGGRQSSRSNIDEMLGPFSTDHGNNLLGEAGCDTVVDAWYTLKDSSHEQQDKPMGQQIQITGSVRLRTFVKRAETDARSDEILRMSSTVGSTSPPQKRLLQQRQSGRRITVRESRGKGPSKLHFQPETEKRHAQNSEEDAPKGEL